jgi:hypothetical protein
LSPVFDVDFFSFGFVDIRVESRMVSTTPEAQATTEYQKAARGDANVRHLF